eukprot:CAMPEP_0174351972 /NCGR_PEP_ID=MMETSP0811_2-20130205/9516_1 /TAXON_ID=73025 ORGANISM="Eutreptiella gymnastica-like, Strain CCMP1594" /NCGR_SAMPLE_ID=MMETSP0811_2 /ASSEMBLY_ACC=CAM_ASM_000667 /LENGTH=146 /DNA_ID=CAMNT_0015481747 /DNA_START=237 /DNA_END=674 /DNA_ORIENTATION=-
MFLLSVDMQHQFDFYIKESRCSGTAELQMDAVQQINECAGDVDLPDWVSNEGCLDASGCINAIADGWLREIQANTFLDRGGKATTRRLPCDTTQEVERDSTGALVLKGRSSSGTVAGRAANHTAHCTRDALHTAHGTLHTAHATHC